MAPAAGKVRLRAWYGIAVHRAGKQGNAELAITSTLTLGLSTVQTGERENEEREWLNEEHSC